MIFQPIRKLYIKCTFASPFDSLSLSYYLHLFQTVSARAGEPANFFSAPAPAPDFFFKRLRLRLRLLIFFPTGSGSGSWFFLSSGSGSGSGSKEPKTPGSDRLRLLTIG